MSDIDEREIDLTDIIRISPKGRFLVTRGELLELLDGHESGERHGFNVCSTGVCQEPCGPTGGCVQ